MDKIFLSALTVKCIVGVWEWERKVRQTVVIDLEMAADIRKAAASDRIEDTIDYKRVSDAVKEFVEGSQYRLLETLAEHTAAFVLREFGIKWIRIVIMKPGALRDARVGVSVERSTTEAAPE